LEKIPTIAINIFKYGNGAVALLTRLFPEANPFLPQGMGVWPEIIGMEDTLTEEDH